jgi:hypothetical protein
VENPIQHPGHPNSGLRKLLLNDRQCERAIFSIILGAGSHHRVGSRKTVRLFGNLQGFSGPVLRLSPRPFLYLLGIRVMREIPQPYLFVGGMPLYDLGIPYAMKI